MPDFFPLFAQSAIVAFQAAWLSVAVYGNIRYPAVNERGFKLVLSMALVAKQDPDAFKTLAGRRIENPKTEAILFKALVASEVIVALLLWLAALGLLLAALGLLDHSDARAFAILAVVGFTALWASLLTGGLWFEDRVGMQDAVVGHSFLLIWGTVTLIFLTVAP